jgi:hypothetical protein
VRLQHSYYIMDANSSDIMHRGVLYENQNYYSRHETSTMYHLTHHTSNSEIRIKSTCAFEHWSNVTTMCVIQCHVHVCLS